MAMAALDRELKNMGTTIVVTLWRKGSSQMYVAGMGDSRVYLLRKGKIEQLTVDHSIAQALVDEQLGEGDENGRQRNKPELNIRQQVGQDREDDERDGLAAPGIDKGPGQAASDSLLKCACLAAVLRRNPLVVG